LNEEFHIPYPDPRIFQVGGRPTDHVTQEKQYVQIIEKIEYPESGGIFVYHVGSLFPAKGFPTPEAINAVNLIKRFLITQFLLLKTDIKYFVAPMILLPYKRKINILNGWLNDFIRLSDDILGPYYLKTERMTPLGQEIYAILVNALTELGIGKSKIISTARIVATIIDYDTAYRYRIEDLMSETKKLWVLEKPIGEIRRLLKILQERDPTRPHLSKKFQAVGYFIAILLILPRFRKIFKKVIKECNFEKLQLDEADRYHVMKLDGYKFLGRTIEDRWPEYVKMHNGKLPDSYILKDGELIKQINAE
jgi:hypothetical protein